MSTSFKSIVHVVWDFHPLEVMMNLRYFLMLILNFRDLETPSGSKFMWIKVYDKSPDHVQPLESSNLKFEPSKNNILSLLRPMDKNPRHHKQAYRALNH